MTEQSYYIEELEILSKEKIEALAEDGIFTCSQLLLAPLSILKKHFSEEELGKVLIRIQEETKGISRGSKACDSVFMISTSSKTLDAKLEGGIKSGCLTQIFSEQRFPRTQLCYSIMLNFMHAFSDSEILYNDPNGMFRPEKLMELAKYNCIDPKTVIDGISVFRPYTILQQFEIFEIIADKLETVCHKLIIVDGLGDFLKLNPTKNINIFYKKKKALEGFLLRLNYVATNDNIPVILLNNALVKFEDNLIVPEAGGTISFAFNTQMLLYKREDFAWQAKIIDGDSVTDAVFNITEYGVGDVI